MDWMTAGLCDLVSVVSELIFVSVVTNPQVLLKTSDYRGIAMLKITLLLQCEPTFAVDTSNIRFLDGYSFLDEQHDASVLVTVTASGKKDLADQKFPFNQLRLPFVGALRLVFSEYLDKSLSSDENFIFALVEVLGGTINCNVGLLKSNKPLVEECKNGI